LKLHKVSISTSKHAWNFIEIVVILCFTILPKVGVVCNVLLSHVFCNVNRVVLLQGSNFITGAIILNGIACGMIFRPLTATVRPAASDADDDKRIKPPQSIIFRKIIEEKQCQRMMSNGSLDGTVITTDNVILKTVASDSVVNGLQVIPEHEEEYDTYQNEVSCSRTVYCHSAAGLYLLVLLLQIH